MMKELTAIVISSFGLMTAPANAMPLPKMVAHRGAGDLMMPEASVEAYSNAVATAVDIVKLDLQYTKDGIVGRPILGFIADKSQGTQCAGFKDIVFRNVTASGLEKPLFRGTKDCPLQGFTFEGCRFESVPEASLPVYRRHGAAAWDRFVGADDVFCDIRVK